MLTANVYTQLDLSDQAAALNKLPPVEKDEQRPRAPQEVSKCLVGVLSSRRNRQSP